MLFSNITDKYRYITQNAKLHHNSLKNNIDKVKSILVRKNRIRLDLHLYLNTHQLNLPCEGNLTFLILVSDLQCISFKSILV
jgi:hypothetical protein